VKKVTQTFYVRRKRTKWDKFLDALTFRKRSAIQEVEVGFLMDGADDADVLISGLYIVESKLIRKNIEDF
jgi:hypothetical protein